MFHLLDKYLTSILCVVVKILLPAERVWKATGCLHSSPPAVWQKRLFTPTEEHKGRRRAPANTLPQLLPGPSQEPLAHQRFHFHSPGGKQGHNARWQPRLRTPCLGQQLRRAIRPGVKLITKPKLEHLSTCERGGAVYRTADTLQDAREEHFGIVQDLLWDV